MFEQNLFIEQLENRQLLSAGLPSQQIDGGLFDFSQSLVVELGHRRAATKLLTGSYRGTAKQKGPHPTSGCVLYVESVRGNSVNARFHDFWLTGGLGEDMPLKGTLRGNTLTLTGSRVVMYGVAVDPGFKLTVTGKISGKNITGTVVVKYTSPTSMVDKTVGTFKVKK